jgi:hypothetical protein
MADEPEGYAVDPAHNPYRRARELTEAPTPATLRRIANATSDQGITFAAIVYIG